MSALTPPPLTDEQRSIVEAPLRPLLVIAGAGSGKTYTMAARAAWVSSPERGDHAVFESEVLGLTFTRKAAAELADRMTRRARLPLPDDGFPGPGPQVSTYHAFAGAVVAEFGGRLGFEADRAVVAEGAAFQIADGVVRDWHAPLDVDLAPATVAARVRLLAAECAEHAVDTGVVRAALLAALDTFDRAESGGLVRSTWPRAPIAALRNRLALLPLVEAYAERKHRLGVVDYGDQVVMALQLAADAAVVTELRRRHRVVILDEYQDTSSAQSRLLAALFGAGHAVTAVGDPQQSIFGWRGAGAGTLRGFLDQFTYPAGGVGAAPDCVFLSTSWRNDTLVLDVADGLATGLPPDPGLPTAPRLRPRPDAAKGSVHVAWVASARDEADHLTSWLARRRRPGRTQAVLCRTRSSFTTVVGQLSEAGIPAAVIGLGGLLDEPVVIDVVSLLAVAHDPGDGPALLRLLTGPRWALSGPDLDALRARVRWLSLGDDRAGLAEAVEQVAGDARRDDLTPDGAARIREVAQVVARVRQAATRLPLPDVVATAGQVLGVAVEAAVWSPDPRRPRRVLDRLAQEAADFTAVADGLGGFLAWLDAARDFERGLDAVDVDPDPSAVQVLTVHAAKGLEWDDVVVVDLADGGFPSAPRAFHWLGGEGGVPWPVRGDRDRLPHWAPDGATDAAQFRAAYDGFVDRGRAHRMREERRLAYVAVTRARENLLLIGSAWVRERVSARTPSPFLVEAAAVPGVVRRIWVDVDVAAAARDAVVMPWPRGVPVAAATRLAAGAGRVRAAIDELAAAGGVPARAGVPAPCPGAEPTGRSEAERQWSQLVDRLVDGGGVPGRSLPRHLSASQLVALARDPRAAVADMIRPIPVEPRPGARRGSSFHAWVERRLTAATLLDLEDMPGAADEDVYDEVDLTAMQQRFESGEWASAPVVDVEVPFDVRIATAHGLVSLRGRIDAVTRGTDGRLCVVDWKTGTQPSGREAAARSVQLAVYRLAAANLYGLDVDQVGAAFWYAQTGRTVRPVDILDVTELTALVESAYVVTPDESEPPVTGSAALAPVTFDLRTSTDPAPATSWPTPFTPLPEAR